MGPRSETYRDDNVFDQMTNGGQEVSRTDIESENGDVYSSRGTPEESQRGASDAYHKDCDDD